MGIETGIEWATSTFNPVIGCRQVSPACTHCYAMTSSPVNQSRKIGLELWGTEKDSKRRVISEDKWNEVLKWQKDAVKYMPAFDKPQPHRIFCASLGDIFEDFGGQFVDHLDRPSFIKESVQWAYIFTHEEGPTPTTYGLVRRRLWSLIEATPNLTWMLLTKRIENVSLMVPPQWMDRGFPSNVWIGTTVENQEYADERIPHLIKLPAKVRWLSVEPMLGPIDLCNVKSGGIAYNMVVGSWSSIVGQVRMGGCGKVNWVIAGGETQKDSRPMRLEWVRSLRDQCDAAGVPFFMKQWGDWVPHSQCRGTIPEGAPIHTFDGEPYFRVGKRLSGKSLDGREWTQFPE